MRMIVYVICIMYPESPWSASHPHSLSLSDASPAIFAQGLMENCKVLT